MDVESVELREIAREAKLAARLFNRTSRRPWRDRPPAVPSLAELLSHPSIVFIALTGVPP
jgi:hypothetical protein